MSASVVRDVEPLTVRTTLSCSSGLEMIKRSKKRLGLEESVRSETKTAKTGTGNKNRQS